MHSLRQSLRVLVDPVDGVPVAVSARRWPWPLALLVLTLGFAAAGFALRWDATSTVLTDLESSGKLANTSSAELAEAVVTAQRVKLISGLAFAVFASPVLVLLAAGALKLLLWLLGQRAAFAGAFTAICVALLPVALFHAVLGLCEFWQIALTPDQAHALVPSHLAALAHPSSHKLRQVFEAIDFFQLWSAALLGLGLASLTGMARGRAIGLGLLLYVAYVAVFVLGVPGLLRGHP